MKNITLTLLFLGLFSGLSAQYVTIPDANFRNRLIQQYPSCFNASQQMDTTCSEVVNAPFLVVTSSRISNLDGVQYFDNITELHCDGIYLTSIPSLPNSIQFLDCERNQLTSLPALPSSLLSLKCSYNQLTSLPALPMGVRLINCHGNQLTSLPELPNSLQSLSCSQNQLTSLPSLSSLVQLWCSSNQLTNLPTLPNSFRALYCEDNLLTSLPILPSGLFNLYCEGNNLSSLPLLPSSLGFLVCSNNPILSCLPPLPSALSLSSSSLVNTSINCIPNYTQYTTQASTGLPLCTNPNHICQPIATSINEANQYESSLSLYPVPVAEQLTVNFNAVKSGEVGYRLLDLQGRLLQEQQLSVVEGENISRMDMSQLGAGMYLLQVVGEQGSVSSKIVKE